MNVLKYFRRRTEVEKLIPKNFERYTMTEDDLKNVIYGSIKEVFQNRKYFFDGIASQHLTESGRQVMCEMLELYGKKVLETIRAQDEQRSKDLVLKTLKEDN